MRYLFLFVLRYFHRHRLIKDAKIQRELQTSVQIANIQERRLSFLKRIQSFRSVQHAYMPEASSFIALEDEEPDAFASVECIVLYLPSQLPPSAHPAPSNTSLALMESKLWYAQACDALIELRQLLSMRAHLSKFKRAEVRGQQPNTRAQGLLNRANSRTDAIAAKYRCAREAYKNHLIL